MSNKIPAEHETHGPPMTTPTGRRYIATQFYLSDSAEARLLSGVIGMAPTTFVLASAYDAQERECVRLREALKESLDMLDSQHYSIMDIRRLRATLRPASEKERA